MKAGDHLLWAAKKQAEGELEVHKANIKVYQTMPAGIGEHSEILAEINKWTDKLSQADEYIASLQGYFTTGGSMVSVIQDTEPETEVEEKELLKGNEYYETYNCKKSSTW